MRRDYADNRLDAADWTGFRDGLTGEMDAANAQLERFDRQRDALTAEAV